MTLPVLVAKLESREIKLSPQLEYFVKTLLRQALHPCRVLARVEHDGGHQPTVNRVDKPSSRVESGVRELLHLHLFDLRVFLKIHERYLDHLAAHERLHVGRSFFVVFHYFLQISFRLWMDYPYAIATPLIFIVGDPPPSCLSLIDPAECSEKAVSNSPPT